MRSFTVLPASTGNGTQITNQDSSEAGKHGITVIDPCLRPVIFARFTQCSALA
ncbi:hypothetical protein [Nocardia donostiensis]|uniref:hypothetical protein n=1 Tax=Nocardia donostiensis TaxID=1538463 RepID=UPI00158A5EF4|nr:hypothetical protein [Nocardia donostiensis]